MWEHKWVECRYLVEKVNDVLQQASEKGWELVSVVSTDDGTGYTTGFAFFFKRPKER